MPPDPANLGDLMPFDPAKPGGDLMPLDPANLGDLVPFTWEIIIFY